MSDILVIGGGIAGLSAAARLAPHAKVTVLEREAQVGHHASGRSAAMFEENYGLPSTVALNKASKSFYFDETAQEYLSPRGFLIVAGPDERAAFDADAETLGADAITLDRARKMVPILNPDSVAFAGYHVEAYDIDTDRLMQGFIKTLRASGGEVVTRAPVSEITRTSEGWQVTASGKTYTATTLINAAGAWADVVAGMAGITPIGLTPLRRSMARIPAPGGHDVRNWPMFFGVGESWYAKPDAGALIVSPAEEDPLPPQDAWADDMVLAEGIARYEHHVTEPVTRMLSSWAGLRSFAPDRALVLGPEPADRSFVWSAGQGGYGFQTAPAASQLVADLVMGYTSPLPNDILAQLTPDRLRV